MIHTDRIVILDDGKIHNIGTHEQLLKNCDVYREIAKSQLSAKELGMDESEVSDNE